MAIYLGSELVNFNTAHDVKQYASWIGGSYSISYKSNSTKKSGIASAVVYAPEGCSIYANQVITSSSARAYSSASATSIFYQIRGYVYGGLCDIVSAPVYNCSQYYSEVIHSKTIISTSSMFVVGAAVNAFAITDTIIKDSTLMYSRSTGVQSFFTGIITPFTKVNASLLQTVPSRAFNHRSELTAVNFPMCTTIEEFAFYFCKSLATISFPVCTSIGYSAFYNCPSLTIANFPMCTTIGDSAFEVCSELTAINFPACTTIGNSAFKACYSLATISFPVCTSIGSYAFYNCLSLTTANFPMCTTIGNSAFGVCLKLATISFPVCTSIGSYAFDSCYSLTAANFPMCTTIGNYAFTSCYNLISLNLTNVSSVPILSGTSAFNSTPIGGYSASAGQFGSIYVPASLYNDFLTAENWSDVSSRIVSV